MERKNEQGLPHTALGSCTRIAGDWVLDPSFIGADDNELATQFAINLRRPGLDDRRPRYLLYDKSGLTHDAL